MISNRKELKRVLKLEKKFYIFSIKDYLKSFLSSNERYLIWTFQKNLRKSEYYFNKNTLVSKILYFFSIRKKNKLGHHLGIHMMINCIDEGLCIYHSGNIVISGLAKIGKNLKLHGSNCVGNNGKNDIVPLIGDNVDIGFGAVVIGAVTIGNNCIIGSNSVVNKSFDENSIIVGVPGKNAKKS